MAVKLWTVHFMRICIANLLLFISLYVLFPVLSIEMGDRLGVPVAQTGVAFLFFTLGMFLIGPFHAYLVDAYKRKTVCVFSFALMVAATVGYAFVTNITELILLSTVQGLAFGIATTAGITLAIDVTNSTLRSAGNVGFSWMARLGMILGIILGVWLYQSYSFQNLLSVSVITGAAGILIASGVYVPFRAPIVTKLYSFDRFLLLRGWVPAINMLLIAFAPGALLPLMFVGDYWSLAALAVLVFITVPFMKMFVKLSHHCQRGTANTTHLLASEVGISLGIATACYLDLDTDKMLHIGQIVALVSLAFFVIATYPYYIRKKVR